MGDVHILTRTAAAESWLRRPGSGDDIVRRALLSTVDGHRSVIELVSVARAMGLDARALEDFLTLGLLQPQTVPPRTDAGH